MCCAYFLENFITSYPYQIDKIHPTSQLANIIYKTPTATVKQLHPSASLQEPMKVPIPGKIILMMKMARPRDSSTLTIVYGQQPL
jgi:hypothetical protein